VAASDSGSPAGSAREKRARSENGHLAGSRLRREVDVKTAPPADAARKEEADDRRETRRPEVAAAAAAGRGEAPREAHRAGTKVAGGRSLV
jgi:hypothetical protein